MAALDVYYGESSWLRLVPGTVTGTLITAFGTKIDFPKAVKVAPTQVGAATASTTKAKWNSTGIANGNQLSVPDNSVNINVMSGDAISENTSAATTASMDCSVALSPAQRAIINAAYEAGTPVIAVREIGKFASGSQAGKPAGYEYILGIITGLKENIQKGPTTMDFTITGKTGGAGNDFQFDTGIDYADFNTAGTGAGNTITPQSDGTARTITDLDTTDWTRLQTGKIVFHAVTNS